MSLVKVTSSHTFKGQTLTNGQTYRLRAREAEEVVKASKGNKV